MPSTPSEPAPTAAPRKPRGGGLLRARFAGLTLVAASGGQLAASGAAALELYPLAVFVAALATLGWLPALHGLEHFLKRRMELTSLVALCCGTTGVIALIAAAARHSSGVDTPPEWPWTWILGARLLLPASLAVFGAGLAAHRLLPAWAASALAAGSLIQLLNWTGALALPALLDQGLVFAGASWLGLRVVADPGRWYRGAPR